MPRLSDRPRRNGVAYRVGAPRRENGVRVPIRVQASRRRSRLTLGEWTSALVIGLSIGAGFAFLLFVATGEALRAVP